MTSRSTVRAGVTMGVLAYGIWGLLPLYLHRLSAVGPFEILAHRIVWSLLLLFAIAFAGRRWGRIGAVVVQPRLVAILCVSALLIAANWLIYIVAVTSGRTLQASLGYFINPLLNVLLGMIFLRERLKPLELVAVGLATAGVAIMAVAQGGLPLMALGLALTFGVYGLVRKIAPVEAIEGLIIETMLLAPVAIVWLAMRHELFTAPPGATSLPFLMLTGVVTAVPLLLFAAAAKRLRYSELGLIQYVAPTLQLMCAVIFGEAISPSQLLAFAFIWTGLVLYAGSTWHRGRVAKPVALD